MSKCENCGGWLGDYGQCLNNCGPIYTIVIDGLPACQRPADPLALLEAARSEGVLLCCTYDDKREAEDAARLYRTFYRKVEVVDGPVPHNEEDERV